MFTRLLSEFIQLIYRYRILLFFVMLTLPFRLYGITNPLIDQPIFRQAQTATVVRNFYQTGINLFRTELDLFGTGKEKYLTLEFPIYEAAVTIFYKVFFFNEIWGRIISIIAGYFGAYYLYKLTRLLIIDSRVAFFSALFFLFAPINMIHQRTFLLEPLVITFLLIASYYFCLWVHKDRWQHYLIALSLLTLGFMQKGVYGPFWLLPLFVYYVRKKTLKKIFSLKLLILILVPLGMLFLWQQHVNFINTNNGQEYFTTINKGHLAWNFGTVSDRLDYKMWESRITQVIQGITLKPGLFFLIIGLILCIRVNNSSFIFAWLIAEVIYFFTLFRIQSHNYYQMIMVPAFSLPMAIGLVGISGWVKDFFGRFFRIKNRLLLPFLLTSFFTFYIARSWMHARWDFVMDYKWYQRIMETGKSVPENALGILVNAGYDWNSVYSYYINRKLFLIDAGKLNKEEIIRLQGNGYSFIVIHDFVKYPFLYKEKAFKAAVDYIEKYPRVYQSEDFLVYLFK